MVVESFLIFPKNHDSPKVAMKPSSDMGNQLIMKDQTSTFDPHRRELISNTFTKGILASLAISLSTIKGTNKLAFAAEVINDSVGSVAHPVAIIGGSGRTGMAVAENLAGELGQMQTVLMTRSGKDPFQIVKLPPATKERISLFGNSVDVRDANSILSAFQETKPSVVVFAASASKQGGNSFDVDDVGVENVARACKSVGAKLILISALAVDRPDSKSFQITNTIGGYMDKIMDAKLNGEMKAKQIMGKNYVIIRPGVLLNGKGKNGAKDIELNQGDTIGGGLSRDELAGVVVGAILNGKTGITVEAYRKSTATKLQPEFVIPSGNELYASTYENLFTNAKDNL